MKLKTLTNSLNPKKRICKSIIETPKGSRNKFNYDPDSNLFKLGGMLPEGMIFPFDFGFIPSTVGDDGDALDIMILMDAPAFTGCLIETLVIGMIEASQTQDGKTTENNRLLGVAINSYSNDKLTSIDQLSKSLLSQIEEFFISYNKQRGKQFVVTNRTGPKKAVACLKKGIAAFKKLR